MRALHIDRLSLELPGEAGGDGPDMAVALAARLAAAGGLPRVGDYPVVRVDVTMRPNEPRSALTARIVAEVLSELRRGMG